ncbi:MAG: acetolactate synthase large subunit [Pseudomonadota bacterium]
MTGGEALVETLLASGINVCFANPGTSEMSFVAALDANPDMRCVLCLFEGGVTGAADGYARMTALPAVTLLHLGPGFGNGWSNLHNARKAGSPVLNVVGDHADYHLKYDAPLQSDLDGVARSVSNWTRRIDSVDDIARDTAAGVKAAKSNNGQIATLILPADVAWSDTGGAASQVAEAPRALHRPDADRVRATAARLREPGTALLVSAAALYGELADVAGRIKARTGCELLAPFFAPRVARGEGAVEMAQMRYQLGQNTEFLAKFKRIIYVGETPPVTFFAYPGKPSTPDAPGTDIERLCFGDWDIEWTLHELARAAGVDGSETIDRVELNLPSPPAPGPLTTDAIGRVLALQCPENAIMVNEALTAGHAIWPHVDKSRAHDRLKNTGGSIGMGLPAGVGAAIACPDRKVVVVSGDGSAMYQLQSLWTAAREKLDITVIIIANGGYRILHEELAALGVAPPGRNAQRMFDIVEPDLDWVSLAKGHGVEGLRAETVEDFDAALKIALDSPEPFLVEAVV